MCRILIADDQIFMRKFVRELIEAQTGWIVCGEAVNGKEAVMQAQILKPDLIIMDVHMPVINGLDATKKILLLRPQTVILILSIDEATNFSEAAALCGARGYLPKCQAGADLVAAVNALLRHEAHFSHVFRAPS